MIKTVLDKYGELLAEEGQNLRPEVISVLISSLHSFLFRHKQQINVPELRTSTSFISKHLIDWYNRDGDWPRRTTYIEVMLFLNLSENDELVALIDRVQEYVANAPYDSYSKLNRLALETIVTSYPEHFRNSAIRELDILRLGKKYISSQEKVNLVTGLLDKIATIPQEQKESYYDAIFDLKCANDPNSITRFYEELLNIKSQAPDLVKKYVRSRGIFNAAQKKKLREQNIKAENPSS